MPLLSNKIRRGICVYKKERHAFRKVHALTFWLLLALTSSGNSPLFASIRRVGQHFLRTGAICFYSQDDKSRRETKGNDELTGICVVHSLPPFWNLRSNFKMVAYVAQRRKYCIILVLLFQFAESPRNTTLEHLSINSDFFASAINVAYALR